MDGLQDRNHLIEENLSIVGPIAAGISERVPGCVEYDDIRSAGIVGLVDAADRYDPSTGTPFGAYARYRVRGAILDYLREQDHLKRDQRKLHRDIQTCADSMYGQHGDYPTRREIAKKLDIRETRVERIMSQAKAPVSISCCPAGLQPINGTGAGDEPVAPKESQPDVQTQKQQLADAIREVMDETLAPRYQMVVELYYAGEMTMKEIGQTVGVNESRVSQIHKSALAKMRRAFEEAGVNSATDLLDE